MGKKENYSFSDYLHERGRLIRVAQGKESADLVLKGGKVVSVDSGEVFEADVAIKGERIALVGDASHCIGPETEVVKVHGKWLSPGIMDAHMHIESSLLTVTQLARILLPRGITAIFADPHEVGNVLGVNGIRKLWEEAQGLPMRVFICVSSLVPSAPGFETSGAVLGADEIEEMLQWENVPALGELFGMVGGEEQLKKIYHAITAGKIVNGHTEMMSPQDLNAFIAAGVQDSHNANTLEEAHQLLRLGAKAIMMEGSLIKQLDNLVPIITQTGVDPRHILICTDDATPEDIVKNGHLDRAVRKTIQLGVDPITALQIASLNCAEHYHLNRDLGSIAPGKLADILVLNDLESFEVHQVYTSGQLVAEDGAMVIDYQPYDYPEWMLDSIHINKNLSSNDFRIHTQTGNSSVDVRVMTANVLNKELHATLPVEDGVIKPDIENDILKMCVVERHSGEGKINFGFVKGFGLKKGALASSLAHNHHNLIAVGTNDEDIAAAINHVIEIKGGFVAAANGKAVMETPLPIAGLLSAKSGPELVAEMDRLNQYVRDELGGILESPLMVLTFMGLAVVEELHITDLGLVQGAAEKFVPLVIT